jgi:hypothetical protein
MQGIVSSFTRDYMLPPFYITTEVHATRRNYGHYMTNFVGLNERITSTD